MSGATLRSCCGSFPVWSGSLPTCRTEPALRARTIGINGNGAGGKQSAIGNFSGNGSRPDAIDITADGVHVSDPGCNCASPVSPNVEMIQEFKVQGASFAAENSKGPVVVSSVAKSGGSEFHGEGYYYGRRPELNSNDWLANRTHLKRPNSSYSFPGFNIGGPLLIPGTSFNKDRNKVFFFAATEFIRQNIDTGTRRAVVPTADWRKGDFSDQSYLDKLNGGKWAIKSRPTKNGFVDGRLVGTPDPGGLALMNLYPLPNVDPAENDGYNWVELGTVEQPMTQLLARVDYSISENTKLYTRYNMQRETQPFKYGLWWDSSQVPLPSRIIAPERLRFDLGQYVPRLQPDFDQRVHLRLHLYRLPQQVGRPEQGVEERLSGIPTRACTRTRSSTRFPRSLTGAAESPTCTRSGASTRSCSPRSTWPAPATT